MPFAFDRWKDRHEMTDYELESLLDRLRRQRDERRQRRQPVDPIETQERRDARRDRRQRIINRLAELAGLVGGQRTGANWIGKAIAVFILSAAAGVIKWIFSR